MDCCSRCVYKNHHIYRVDVFLDMTISMCFVMQLILMDGMTRNISELKIELPLQGRVLSPEDVLRPGDIPGYGYARSKSMVKRFSKSIPTTPHTPSDVLFPNVRESNESNDIVPKSYETSLMSPSPPSSPHYVPRAVILECTPWFKREVHCKLRWFTDKWMPTRRTKRQRVQFSVNDDDDGCLYDNGLYDNGVYDTGIKDHYSYDAYIKVSGQDNASQLQRRTKRQCILSIGCHDTSNHKEHKDSAIIRVTRLFPETLTYLHDYINDFETIACVCQLWHSHVPAHWKLYHMGDTTYNLYVNRKLKHWQSSIKRISILFNPTVAKHAILLENKWQSLLGIYPLFTSFFHSHQIPGTIPSYTFDQLEQLHIDAHAMDVVESLPLLSFPMLKILSLPWDMELTSWQSIVQRRESRIIESKGSTIERTMPNSHKACDDDDIPREQQTLTNTEDVESNSTINQLTISKLAEFLSKHAMTLTTIDNIGMAFAEACRSNYSRLSTKTDGESNAKIETSPVEEGLIPVIDVGVSPITSPIISCVVSPSRPITKSTSGVAPITSSTTSTEVAVAYSGPSGSVIPPLLRVPCRSTTTTSSIGVSQRKKYSPSTPTVITTPPISGTTTTSSGIGVVGTTIDAVTGGGVFAVPSPRLTYGLNSPRHIMPILPSHSSSIVATALLRRISGGGGCGTIFPISASPPAPPSISTRDSRIVSPLTLPSPRTHRVQMTAAISHGIPFPNVTEISFCRHSYRIPRVIPDGFPLPMDPSVYTDSGLDSPNIARILTMQKSSSSLSPAYQYDWFNMDWASRLWMPKLTKISVWFDIVQPLPRFSSFAPYSDVMLCIYGTCQFVHHCKRLGHRAPKTIPELSKLHVRTTQFRSIQLRFTPRTCRYCCDLITHRCSYVFAFSRAEIHVVRSDVDDPE